MMTALMARPTAERRMLVCARSEERQRQGHAGPAIAIPASMITLKVDAGDAPDCLHVTGRSAWSGDENDP